MNGFRDGKASWKYQLRALALKIMGLVSHNFVLLFLPPQKMLNNKRKLDFSQIPEKHQNIVQKEADKLSKNRLCISSSYHNP